MLSKPDNIKSYGHLATLNDGAALTVNNLQGSMFGPFSADLVANRAATGPLRDSVRADAYTKTLTFIGALQEGENTLTIEVRDVADGFLDSGVLVKAGTFRSGQSNSGVAGTTVVVTAPETLEEGRDGVVVVTVDPGLGGLDAPVTVILTPENPDIDLGNGPGQPVAVTVQPGGPLVVEVPIRVPNNHATEDDRIGIVSVTTASSDPTLDGLPVAPVLVTIIDPINEAPVAVADAYALREDSVLTVAAGDGVLANDTDANGDTLTATLVTGPSHGTLAFNPDGSFAYTPDADYFGADSFTYRAGDGIDASSVAQVDLVIAAVNDAPTASEDSYSLNEDTVLTVPAAGLIANDADIDGDPLTAVLVDGPDHGTLSLAANGAFTYTPDANYFGSDSFTYSAHDGDLASTPATVSLTIAPVNDAPVITSGGGGASATIHVDEDMLDRHGHGGNGHSGHGHGHYEHGRGHGYGHGHYGHHDHEGSGYVTTIMARDIDGDRLSYSLSGRDVRLFTIDRSGELAFKPGVDVDDRKTYLVDVTVTDPSGAKDKQSLKVVIEDDDKMKGSSSAADTFVFADEYEGVVKDFKIGQDVVELHGTGFDTLQDMLDAHAIEIRQQGRDTLLKLFGFGDDDDHFGHGRGQDHGHGHDDVSEIVIKGVRADLIVANGVLLT